METRLLCSIFIRWLLCTFLEIFFLIFPFQVGFQRFFLRLRNNSEWVYLHKFAWADFSWSIQPQGPFRPWERRKSFSTVPPRLHHPWKLLSSSSTSSWPTTTIQDSVCPETVVQTFNPWTMNKGNDWERIEFTFLFARNSCSFVLYFGLTLLHCRRSRRYLINIIECQPRNRI